MDTSLLERLLVKPIPKKYQPVDIILQRTQEDMPPIDIEAMGEEAAIALRQRLAQYEKVHTQITSPESVSQEVPAVSVPRTAKPKTAPKTGPTKSKTSMKKVTFFRGVR